MKRFDYQLLDNKEILILVNGRDKKDGDGKFIDIFTQKKFRISSKEILEFQKVLTDVAFDWCDKFKSKLDLPECY